MHRRALRKTLTAFAISLVAPAAATAAMSHTALTWGVLPSDVASAQAFSIFSDQVSATWYNPASLTRGPEGELTSGLFYGQPRFEVTSRGGTNAPTRSGKVLDDTPSEQVLIGMKTDLSRLIKSDHPVYFGFMAGVERFGTEMMAFQSETSNTGQTFNYGRQPLFLNLGGGTNLWRGIDVGGAVRITLHADATMETYSDLAGNTEREKLDVAAEPVMMPIVGFNIAMGETFCSVTPCWMDNLDTALVYKGYAKAQTNVEANAVIPGTVPSPGLDLAIRTIDSFQPEIITIGAQYRWGDFRFGFTAEQQLWSRLDDQLKNDDVKEQANLRFKDIWIPRAAVAYQWRDNLSFTAGLAYEESPLKGERSEEVNYLDNDRIILGLGGTLEIATPPILAHPIRLDLGYQYHHFEKRDFTLSGTADNGNPYEERVTVEGEAHAISGSLTIQF